MPSPVSAETESAFAEQPAACGDQVDLVGDKERVGAGPGDGARRIGGLAGVEDEEPQFGGRGAGAGAAHPFLLDRVGAVAQPGGVGENHRIAGEIDRHLDDVARRAGDRRGDRGLPPCDAVEQARLAGIGRTDDRHRDAVAQPLAAAAIGEMAADLAGESAGLRQATPLRSRRQVFLGKIDRRFEMSETRSQPRATNRDRCRPIRLRAGARPGAAAPRSRPRRDRRPPRPAVRSSLPFTKARRVNSPGSASRSPSRARASDQRSEHSAAAMHLQLGDVLAGEAARRREPQRRAPSSIASPLSGSRSRHGAPCAAAADPGKRLNAAPAAVRQIAIPQSPRARPQRRGQRSVSPAMPTVASQACRQRREIGTLYVPDTPPGTVNALGGFCSGCSIRRSTRPPSTRCVCDDLVDIGGAFRSCTTPLPDRSPCSGRTRSGRGSRRR